MLYILGKIFSMGLVKGSNERRYQCKETLDRVLLTVLHCLAIFAHGALD
jgi:hypothetical protein